MARTQMESLKTELSFSDSAWAGDYSFGVRISKFAKNEGDQQEKTGETRRGAVKPKQKYKSKMNKIRRCLYR